MFIVINAWVFFRIDDMSDAFDYMQAMYFLNDHSESFNLKIHNSFNSLFITSFVLGLLFCFPIFQRVKACGMALIHGWGYGSPTVETVRTCLLVSLLYICISFLAVNSYNPFIYFRF
jgi:alginate O-acetyltransferase complex protein AlgI